MVYFFKSRLYETNRFSRFTIRSIYCYAYSMITLDDIDPEVAGVLRELVANMTAIGEGEEAEQMIDRILIGIEENRAEAEKLEAEEKDEK